MYQLESHSKAGKPKPKRRKMKRGQIRNLLTLIGVGLLATGSDVRSAAVDALALSFPRWLLGDPHFNTWMLNACGKISSVRLADGLLPTTQWQAIDPGWVSLLPTDTKPTVSQVPADIGAGNYDSTDVYLTGSGLGSYIMGPWYRAGGPGDRFEFRPIDR